MQDIDIRVLKLTIGNLVLDTSRELFVLCHGFGGDWPKTYMDPQKDALLALVCCLRSVSWKERKDSLLL